MVNPGTLIEEALCGGQESEKATRAEVYRKCVERNAILPGESIILTPLVIPTRELTRISRDCVALLELISSLADRLFDGSRKRLLEVYCPERLVPFVERTCPPLGKQIVYRLDTYIAAEGLKILEINVGPWVGGLSLSRLFGCVTEIPAVKSRIERDGITCREPFSAAMETIVQACRVRNVNVLALVENQNTRAHSERAVAEAIDRLRHLGLDALHLTPADLRLDANSGSLMFQGKRIEGIGRLFPLSALTSMREDYRPIIDAIQRGTVTDIALAETWLVGCKAAFAMLWNKEARDSFTEQERSLIEQYIPPTWQLSPTTNEVTLKQQDQVVLKPNYGFGGGGVICGWELTAKQWESEIEKALRSEEKYILQRRVISRGFPSVFYSPDGDLVESPNCPVVLGLFIAGGNFIGAYVRAHPVCNGVINVKNGAAVGAVLEDAEAIAFDPLD
jgi:hypothetical protein